MRNTEAEEFVKRHNFRFALLLVVAAAAVLAATAGVAAAKTPCGVKVIDDWYGSKTGQLRHIYPLGCYRDALKLIGKRADVDIYSTARQDILFALQQAIAAGKSKSSDPPSFLGGPDASHVRQPLPKAKPATIRSPTVNNPGPPPRTSQGSNTASVPLPAIVLGTIAILLLSLGSAAYLARRRQMRHQTLRPQAPSGRRDP